MNLAKGGVKIEADGRDIKLGNIKMSPAEVSQVSSLLAVARGMLALPVLMPIDDKNFEVRFNGDKTFDFVRLGNSREAEVVYPNLQFSDMDNIIVGLKEAINSHIDRNRLSGEIRGIKTVEFLPEEPEIR